MDGTAAELAESAESEQARPRIVAYRVVVGMYALWPYCSRVSVYDQNHIHVHVQVFRQTYSAGCLRIEHGDPSHQVNCMDSSTRLVVHGGKDRHFHGR